MLDKAKTQGERAPRCPLVEIKDSPVGENTDLRAAASPKPQGLDLTQQTQPNGLDPILFKQPLISCCIFERECPTVFGLGAL